MSLAPLSAMVLGAALFSGAPATRAPRGGDDCGALREAYAAALARARACAPGATDACRATRPAALDDPCRCQLSIDPAQAAELDAVTARYRERACPAAAGLCTRRCVAPAGRCVAGEGEGGQCR